MVVHNKRYLVRFNQQLFSSKKNHKKMVGDRFRIMNRNFLIAVFGLFILLMVISFLVGEVKGQTVTSEGITASAIMFLVSFVSFFAVSSLSTVNTKMFMALVGWLSVFRFVIVGLSLLVVYNFTSMSIWTFAVCLILSYIVFQITEVYYLIQKLKSK